MGLDAGHGTNISSLIDFTAGVVATSSRDRAAVFRAVKACVEELANGTRDETAANRVISTLEAAVDDPSPTPTGWDEAEGRRYDDAFTDGVRGIMSPKVRAGLGILKDAGWLVLNGHIVTEQKVIQWVFVIRDRMLGLKAL